MNSLTEESRNYSNISGQTNYTLGNNEDKRLSELKEELNRYKLQLKQSNDELERLKLNLNDSEKSTSSFNYIPKVIGKVFIIYYFSKE